MDIVPGDPQKNRKLVKKWAEEEVTKNSSDILVLPEMWTTAYTLSSLNEIADRDGEPTKCFLKKLAKTLNVNIIGGSIANKVNGNLYNTALVYDRSGNLVYEYNKVHLVPMLDEHHYLTGGKNPPEIFHLEGIKMGLVICFDLRFPEIIRSLALEGAQVLHIVAEWPCPRIDHWKYLQIARAIENQMYIVSSNRVGEYNSVKFCGTSMIIDPWGEIMKEGSKTNEESIFAELDLLKVKEVRKKVPIFSCRVPHLYK